MPFCVYLKANNLAAKFQEVYHNLSSETYPIPLAFYAAASGNIRYLESHKRDASDTTNDGNIVNVAVYYNQPEVIKWAIANNISPVAASKTYGIPLRKACERYQINCVIELVKDETIRKSLYDPHYGSTVCLACLNKRFFEALPILIDNNLNINRCNFDYWPLILHGAASNSSLIPSQLVRLGVPIDSCEQYSGWTALHVSASKHQRINVIFFLEYGASPFKKTHLGFTPFMLANTFDKNDRSYDCAQCIRDAICLYMAKRFLIARFSGSQ